MVSVLIYLMFSFSEMVRMNNFSCRKDWNWSVFHSLHSFHSFIHLFHSLGRGRMTRKISGRYFLDEGSGA